MPYGKRSSVAGKIARGKTKPAMAKKKTTKKANGKGFMSKIQSNLENKIDKKKKAINRKFKKVKGMFT